MPPRRQFSKDERNFLVMEYHKRRGIKGFKSQLELDFTTKFLESEFLRKMLLRRCGRSRSRWDLFSTATPRAVGPVDTHSGRIRNSRTPANMARVKAVIDRDAPKVIN